MTQQVKETKSVIDQIKTKLTKKINQETKPKQNANWGIKQKKKKKKKKAANMCKQWLISRRLWTEVFLPTWFPLLLTSPLRGNTSVHHQLAVRWQIQEWNLGSLAEATCSSLPLLFTSLLASEAVFSLSLFLPVDREAWELLYSSWNPSLSTMAKREYTSVEWINRPCKMAARGERRNDRLPRDRLMLGLDSQKSTPSHPQAWGAFPVLLARGRVLTSPGLRAVGEGTYETTVQRRKWWWWWW